MMTTDTPTPALVLQRARLLRQLLILGDIEECAPHLTKLATLAPDMWSALDPLYRDQRYGDMMAWLIAWEQHNAGVQVYLDPETEALKTELRLLTAHVEDLQAEYGDRERRITDFEHRYMQELGTLIAELLALRVEHTRTAYDNNPTEETSAHYEQAQKEQSGYADTAQALRDMPIAQLTPEETHELKKLYREAVKLCHPDTVSDEQKKHATRMFHAVQQAYDTNALPELRTLVDQIRHGRFVQFADTVHEKDRLRVEIQRVRRVITELRSAIRDIEQNDTYQTILTMTDEHEYFRLKQEQLREEIERYRTAM